MIFKRIFKLLREISSVRYGRAEEKENSLKVLSPLPQAQPIGFKFLSDRSRMGALCVSAPEEI